MTANLVFDHAVLVVGELQTAVRQFNQMGFTVTPGGVHTGGLTYNAIVSFADGSYLELLATTSKTRQGMLVWLRRLGLLSVYTARDNAFHRRFTAGIAGGLGLSDFCLLSLNLDLEVPALQRAGLPFEGPLPGGRVRPDGQQVSWRTAVPSTADLPFLIDDISPRELRVPPSPPGGHPNQVNAIAGITLGVRNLNECTDHFRSLIGVEPDSMSHFPLPGVQAIEFPLGAARISLIQPGLSMRRALGRRQARALILWLGTPAREPSGLLGLSFLPGKGITLSRGNPFA